MAQSQQTNSHQHVQYPPPSNVQYIPNQIDPATYQQQPQQAQYHNIQYQQVVPNQSHSGYIPQPQHSHHQHHYSQNQNHQPQQPQQSQHEYEYN